MKRHILTILRVFLGGIFILYAVIKFLGIQFPRVYLSENIDKIDSVTLLWYFFGYSQPYILTVATGELLVGTLMAIPKTTRIGVLFYFPFALNIAIVNWYFSLPLDVKILSTFLAISSLYLLVNNLPIYKKLLM
jgi:uncharacterized membrane protein YphA (DoxX/SURF4 family)